MHGFVFFEGRRNIFDVSFLAEASRECVLKVFVIFRCNNRKVWHVLLLACNRTIGCYSTRVFIAVPILLSQSCLGRSTGFVTLFLQTYVVLRVSR